MIKTLRITSILAAILAAGLFVCPAVFGSRSDKEILEFLSLPSVVEEFRKAQGSKKKLGADQVSPLVAQADLFTKYLNPPKTKKKIKKPKVPTEEKFAVREPEKPRHSLKFKVIATSFYATRPQLSLALIEEPAKGRHWVRQGDVVSHLTIEQIRDGIVIARGGNKTFEQPVEARPPQRSLLAGPSPVSKGTSDRIGLKTVSALRTGETEPAATARTGLVSSEVEQMSPEEQEAWAAKIFAELEAMAVETEDEADKADSANGDLVGDAEAMRITGKEAKKLGRLGRDLKDGRQDPNRPKSRKVENSTKERSKAKKSSSKSKPGKRTTSKKSSTAKKNR
jgi:hypothetical protein